ncbi:WSC domain-containing protein 1 isoform X1 [Salmo salar]|uniref:WSC domain-containing protein 1-like isoform X1 n=1 Tax=Salmo salar TaxID=8030 RepID=A0A1S3NTI0_SALSA|nr:WSC domain-containing protein 1-like isoform X1 [Salmo salar]XP_014018709.1 WSC domain-containing protein 1-like isoform X1 [Salmo salar]|eukprot:XP_014018707.1 PREDICTED: WSC domain-containing protein 1-like isoform X1 [Salmo salar]
MAKLLYRLQRFLRRTQLFLLFLGVAYIMAGSVLLLQRANLVVTHRGATSPPLSSLPSLPSPPRALGMPPVRVGGYGGRSTQIMARGQGYKPGSPLDDRTGTRWLMSRNLEIRHLRRRWFHSLMTEKDMSQVERSTPRRNVPQKGSYMGCFLDNSKKRALKGSVSTDFRKMTSTMCQDTCSARLNCTESVYLECTHSGYQFAGLEYGSECYCGNHITSLRVRDEECNLDCKGEKGSPCGGVGRLSVFTVEDVLPGQRRYRNVRYRGCFREPEISSSTSLVHLLQPNLTSQSCIEACINKEFPLAMLRSLDCFCGYATPDFTLHEPAEEEHCSQSNTTEASLPSTLQRFYQVYQTPVQDSRCTERKFLPEKSSSLVALSSFPGAGNTWVRHLIELATGYYTGSYYFDGTLYNRGFKGEKDYWKSGRTICVKTHESGRREIEMYDSVILLIRNPYRSLMAEFNRKCAGHLGYASDQHWKTKEWPEFVGSYASWWASHVLDWLRFGRRVLVVHFEELQTALVPQLRSITSFLNATVTEDRLLCAESNQDGHFKRSGARQPTFDPFTPDMRGLIDGLIRAVDQALRDSNHTGLPLEYLPR